MYRAWLVSLLISTIFLGACTSTSRSKEDKVYAAGEKAGVGPLTYAVVDTQIYPRLGDDLATARMPVNRFYVIQIGVSNSSNADIPIPALSLVDDSGQTYNELSDGNSVPNWLGVVRKVKPGDTELGSIVFDAPSKHYRLRLTDDLDPEAISIDLPLNFVHEELRDRIQPEAPQTPPLPNKK